MQKNIKFKLEFAFIGTICYLNKITNSRNERWEMIYWTKKYFEYIKLEIKLVCLSDVCVSLKSTSYVDLINDLEKDIHFII